jgi:UrcA family protein
MDGSVRLGAILVFISLAATPAKAHIAPRPQFGGLISDRALPVSLADIDLSSSTGREELLKRVRFAAKLICQRDTIRQLRRNCEAGILAHVIATASPPVRTALAEARRDGR